jgi:hypothetical protein
MVDMHAPTGAPATSAARSWRYLHLGAAILGLLTLLAANYYLRARLERTPLPPYTVFEDNKVPFTWRLLLPYDMGAASNASNAPGTYHWFTTGLAVVSFCEQYAKPNKVFYALNALVIVSSFFLTWPMFRSHVFSFTVAVCMGLGTQLHWVYVCSSLMAFYLFIIYLQANLLCLVKVLETGHRYWRAGFVASLVLLALNHEQWLDYFGFLLLGCAFLGTYSWRRGLPDLRPRVVFLLLSSCAVAAVYLTVRMSYGRQQYHPGDESEMIFNYGSRTLAAEDLFSNVVTYIYLAFSNYFPPCFVASNSLVRHGPEAIIAEQHGYHAAQSHLVAMHHLFSWYYLAGIVFAVFAFSLYSNARAALRDGSTRSVYLTLWLLLIASGFAIHALVKYRPYLSVPVLTYKCMTSVVGVAYLLAFCLREVRDRLPVRLLYPACVLLTWGVLAYGALTRPAYLSGLNKQVGMTGIPDPMRHLHLSPGGAQ